MKVWNEDFMRLDLVLTQDAEDQGIYYHEDENIPYYGTRLEGQQTTILSDTSTRIDKIY